MKNSIQAKVVADSINPEGNRITSMLLVFPRFILPELLTHRVFSRNSASSRAIPFKKMVRSVLDDPFIPVAWQKDHRGMQGKEYLDPEKRYDLSDFLYCLVEIFNGKEDGDLIEIYTEVLQKYCDIKRTLPQWWLLARDLAVESAVIMSLLNVTKQLCNRILEPFMWHTVLVTSTEWDNFMELRCPKYLYKGAEFKSKIECMAWYPETEVFSELDWLKINLSQAEIHIQALAESMWDARNEGTPTELEAGEYHLPFGDKMNELSILSIVDNYNTKENQAELVQEAKIKIITARAARISYTTHDGEIDYEKDIALHDMLLKSRHASPFEHCAVVPTEQEKDENSTDKIDREWFDNFRGWRSYRNILAL